MLVVISDLHFEEESSHHIPGDGVHAPVTFSRNIPAKPHRLFIQRLASEAVRNGARQLDLVLAGDIFDVLRTGLWFGETNPTDAVGYVDSTAVSPELEQVILDIMQAIATTQPIDEVLAVYQMLANGRYLDTSKNEHDFPIPVTFHYVPGNHDRLINATPATRRAMRRYFGMPDSAAPFPYVLDFPEEQVFIRHGHEYDRANFSVDHRKTKEFPLQLPLEQYQAAPLGDFIAIEVASRLPLMFRQHHTDAKILADPILRRLYLRLLEFDDLRPTSAIFNYFMYQDSQEIDPEVAWEAIADVIFEWLDQFYKHPFLLYWLDRFDKKWRLDVIDIVQLVLAWRPWRWFNHIPLKIVQFAADQALRATAGDGAELFATRESTIRNGRHRFLIAGHTHTPKVELIAHDGGGERYYVDTGTWRNRVLATPGHKQFGRLKALSYIIVYGPSEDRGLLAATDSKIASFDYWTGLTQGWTEEESGKGVRSFK